MKAGLSGTAATGGVGIGSVTGGTSGDVRVVFGIKFSLDREQRIARTAAPVSVAARSYTTVARQPLPRQQAGVVAKKPRPVARPIVRKSGAVVGAIGAIGATGRRASR